MNINKRTFIISIIATLVIGLLMGWFIFSGGKSTSKEEHDHSAEVAGETIWTCSMHPQIRQNEPGQCPICGMDLIPLENEQGELDPMAVAMSPTAMQLADVITAEVGEMDPVKNVRLNGKVQEDERLVFSQSSHIPGRIEQLQVNFTGEYVSKGQVIAYIYSPELVTAQEELFEARKIKETQPGLFKSAQVKLKNWKLSDKQIQQILEAGQPKEDFPITADVSGYVISKKVNLGDYIGKGAPIYEIANLSRVWVLFDVYESDLPWVNEGDLVNFTIQSLPGKEFQGKITFLDPVINPKTRVAKARVEVANQDNQLKPEMFASGVVNATLENKNNAPVIPKSAVMWTGERSVVYVKTPSDRGVSFVMREVTLGPSLGESYILEGGLEKGEEIAVSGTFSIDAAAQLAGKPSMMNRQTASPEGGPAMTGHNHGNMTSSTSSTEHVGHNTEVSVNDKAKEALRPVIDQYLSLKNALVEDDLNKAKEAAQSLQNALSKVNMSLFQGEAHNVWMKYSNALEKPVKSMTQSENLEAAREQFISISDQMVMLVKTFKPTHQTLYVQHCPMAGNNQGADWLSTEENIRNPYFGASMLTCGEITSTIK